MKRLPARQRLLFDLLFLLEHYCPSSAWVRERKAALRAQAVEALRRQGPGVVRDVERIAGIAPSEFRRRYLAPGIPVIIANGAASWPLAAKWSFDNFRNTYGHEKIKLVQRKGVADDEEVVDQREYSEEVQFGAFLDQLLNGGRKYMRFSPLLEKFPELLDDFDHEFFRQMSGNGWGVTYQLFMGGAGTYTPLHNAMTSFFFVNVCGVKRWAMIPNHFISILNPAADGFGYNHSGAHMDFSNVEAYPGFECVDRFEALMQPGDVLYVPSWMWHCVRNEAPTIGVRCGFVYPRGMLVESPTLSFIRLFAARNPSTLEALYYVFFKTNLPERDKWLLTAKLIRR
jgi:hypothetical protein